MDKELVISNIYLRAVLPLLEEVVKYDPEAKKIAASIKGTIMFHVSGGPATTISFKGGACEVMPKAVTLPSQGLWFSTPAKLNRMFEGDKKVIPLPWPLPNMGLINKFTKLSDRLNVYMKPTEQLLKDRKNFEFCVELMMLAALYGAREIANNDPTAAKTASSIIKGPIVMDIAGGPAAYIQKGDDGKFSTGKGRPAGIPLAKLALKDYETAYKLFNNKLDANVAVGLGEVKLQGYLLMIDNLNIMLEKLQKYVAA